MPAKGKHRRPKTQRFTRSIAAAGTGGAALALPLIGATGAHASAPAEAVTQTSELPRLPQAPQQAVAQQAAAAQAVKQQAGTSTAAAAKSATTRTYAVKSGDYLSRIAEEQDVTGGWQSIYADNREAIGSNPSLIHPGLELSLDGRAPSSAGAPSSGSGASSSGGDSGSAAKSGASERKAPAEQQAAPERKAPTERKTEAPAEKPAADTSDTRAQGSGGGSSASGFTRPVSGAVGTSYRVSGSMWSSGYHTGVDFAVPTGTSLKAVGSGTVVSAGWGGSYGNQVVVRLADGHYAQYAHLSSLSVSVGQTVGAGQQVGLSGATGNVTGPHLHFEIRTASGYGSDVDPLAYLRAKGVSL
ncbi:LysM peptidoglycan-binding domain-containing M23 family metallopeptidase [Streptomyces sp. CRN 30]|uniref:M23 family metallopeptidase n=1 Tax=Streptomyces sp. CRN 30 TaxID=3075613 RepID=UPI002A82E97F|nr:LysM peptidoglycan-binding domain-containing M23 family metallopeptidase [Streptomyces sp. CRN 30]